LCTEKKAGMKYAWRDLQHDVLIPVASCFRKIPYQQRFVSSGDDMFYNGVHDFTPNPSPEG
jgi:hypothetical protein